MASVRSAQRGAAGRAAYSSLVSTSSDDDEPIMVAPANAEEAVVDDDSDDGDDGELRGGDGSAVVVDMGLDSDDIIAGTEFNTARLLSSLAEEGYEIPASAYEPESLERIQRVVAMQAAKERRKRLLRVSSAGSPPAIEESWSAEGVLTLLVTFPFVLIVWALMMPVVVWVFLLRDPFLTTSWIVRLFASLCAKGAVGVIIAPVGIAVSIPFNLAIYGVLFFYNCLFVVYAVAREIVRSGPSAWKRFLRCCWYQELHDWDFCLYGRPSWLSDMDYPRVWLALLQHQQQ